MLSRHYFAWRMSSEAARRNEEREELAERRLFLSPSRISDTHFVQRYRLTKEGYEYLCEVLRGYVKSSQRVSMETKVLCALLFYANGDYQRVVGVANSFSQEAISRFVHEVTEALNYPDIIAQFIKFPTTPDAREEIKQSFYNRYGFPGVIGCVDGCHFRIFKPKKIEEHLYYCRKHYHSLNVQMVADDNCRILSVNAKYGGATHDAFIWENSQINAYMQTLHQNGEPVWLLGDSGYPQRPWLMTPYNEASPRTAAESYNKTHSKARVTIENTFGRLKNRWRCVCKDRVLHYKPEKCAKIIQACCVLHNIALEFRVPDTELPANEPGFQRHEILQPEDLTMLTLGRVMRDRVASIIHAGN